MTLVYCPLADQPSLTSASFKAGMAGLREELQQILVAQEQRLAQQHQETLAAQEDRRKADLASQEQRFQQALADALADQKKEILESIGKGKHLKAH